MISLRQKSISILVLTVLLSMSCVKESIEIINTDAIVLIIPDSETTDKESETSSTNLDKAINWVENMQADNGLLESAEHTNFVSLYDNALAALVYIETGNLAKAEKIFDFFQARVNDELLKGNGGFYQFRNSFGEGGSRTWMGDNAWLLIALNTYHDNTNNGKYLDMALEIEQWLRTLQDIDGGLWGGYNENGTIIPKVTEGMITAFNAVKGYDSFHQNILSFLKTERWDDQRKILMAWPTNPDYMYALDLHSLGSLIFDNYAATGLTEAARFLNTQTLTVNGTEISGYCFDEDKDVIWLEGTAQMAVAYNKIEDTKNANNIVTELEKSLIKSASMNDSQGIPYASNQGTNYGSDLLWDHADLTPTLSSTAWYIFAKTGINPLALGNKTDIPQSEIFW